MGEDSKKVFQIENHINLLDERLREIAEKLEELLAYHRLPFKRFETLRTVERQKYIFEAGHTKTMNSRHLPNKMGKSEAVDYVLFINNKLSWDNKYKYYYDFLGGMVNERWGEKIRWGGNFKSFYDGPHLELR